MDPQMIHEHEGHFYALWPDPESGLPVLLALPVATEADDHPAHPTQHDDAAREGWYEPIDLSLLEREAIVSHLIAAPAGLPAADRGEHRRMLDELEDFTVPRSPAEDDFTSTVEGAAAFERHRAIDAGELADAQEAARDAARDRDEPAEDDLDREDYA